MKSITIDLWGDINCPFCYVGEVMLDEVLKKNPLPDTKIRVNWRSYRLHSTMPAQTITPWTTMVANLTDPKEIARFEKGNCILQELAKPYNLQLNLEKTLLHNAIDSARLLKLAGEYQLVLALARKLGEGYFAEGLEYEQPPQSTYQSTSERTASGGSRRGATKRKIPRRDRDRPADSPSLCTPIYTHLLLQRRGKARGHSLRREAP